MRHGTDLRRLSAQHPERAAELVELLWARLEQEEPAMYAALQERLRQRGKPAALKGRTTSAAAPRRRTPAGRVVAA